MLIELKKGNKIYIKPKNRGKFTKYCHGKVTDECIRKAKASGNPTLVKRATFAANARKWKHLEGGIINPSSEIEFYKNWLNSRKDKLYENMGNLGNVDSEILRQLNNISEYTYENTNSDKFIGETDHKNKVVRLTPNALPTTLLHEIVHTAIRRDSPLILKLRQLLSLSLDGIINYDYLNKKWKENPNSYAKDLKKTVHYEKLNEYIPRLYEFRMENNLDPNKEYKEEEIIPLMLKSNIPSIKEGYYNPKMFTKALNEVAYNSTSNKKLLAKKGGKAFVEGVNVLDSNPNAYKYVKKKIKKNLLGGNVYSGLISTGLNAGLDIYSAYKKKEAANELGKALDKSTEVSQLELYAKYFLEEMEKLNNETLPDGIHSSNAFKSYVAHQRANKRALADAQKLKSLNELEKALLLSLANQQVTSSIINGVSSLGLMLLNTKFSNKGNANNGAPSTTVNVNGQIVNRENLGAYGLFMT